MRTRECSTGFKNEYKPNGENTRCRFDPVHSESAYSREKVNIRPRAVYTRPEELISPRVVYVPPLETHEK